MKVFILAIAFAVITCVSAQTTPEQVQAEYDALVKVQIPEQIQNYQTMLNMRITDKIQIYNYSYVYARQKFVDELTPLGDSAKSLVTKFDTDIKNAVNELNREYATAALKKQIEPEITKAYTSILSLTNPQVTLFKAAVKRTPATSTCWDQYKAELEQKFQAYSSEFAILSQSAFTDFETVVDQQVQSLQTLIQQHDTDSKTQCEGKDAKCFVDYVSIESILA